MVKTALVVPLLARWTEMSPTVRAGAPSSSTIVPMPTERWIGASAGVGLLRSRKNVRRPCGVVLPITGTEINPDVCVGRNVNVPEVCW